jgi:hypothetical protein
LATATVKQSKAGRRHVLLVTDGQSKDEEVAIRAAARGLREDGIGVTIVRIGDTTTPALAILRDAGAREIDGSNFGLLDSTIGEALGRSRELTFVPDKPLSLSGFREIPSPALLNKVTLKPGAEVLGRSGGAPLVAVRPAGRGRAAASTFSFEEEWAGALAAWPRAGEYVRWLASAVAPRGPRLPADVSLRFENDRLEITAVVRGADRPDKLEVTVDGTPVALPRRGETLTRKYLGTFQGMPRSASEDASRPSPAGPTRRNSSASDRISRRSTPWPRRREERAWRRPAISRPSPAAALRSRAAPGLPC